MVNSVMAKLYSTIMEQKISLGVEHYHKLALGEMALDQKQSIVDPFVTLRVIVEESQLQWKTLYIVVLWTSRMCLTQ